MMNENRLWLLIGVIGVSAFLSLVLTNESAAPEQLVVFHSPTATPTPTPTNTPTPTPTPTPAPVTEDGTWKPEASSDDAWEGDHDSGFNSSNQDLWIRSGSTQSGRINIAIRFRNVDIPQGATINTATSSLYSNTSSRFAVGCIHGHDIDDSPSLGDVTGLPRTTACTFWDSGNVGTGYTTTPSIVGAVQEVIDRVGWVSGNSMTLIFVARDGTQYNGLADAWDHSGTNEATLDVNFTYQP